MKEQKPSDARKGGGDEEKPMNVWDCGSPLYDSYELVSLSHVLDRHMMVLPSLMMSGSRLRAPPPAAATQFISVASNDRVIPSSIIGATTTVSSKKITLSSVVSAFMNKLAGKSMIISTSSGGRARRGRSKPCSRKNQKIVDHL